MEGKKKTELRSHYYLTIKKFTKIRLHCNNLESFQHGKRLPNCRRKMVALTPPILEGFPSLFLASHRKDLRLMITMGIRTRPKDGTAHS
ncbi:hypothetical protein CEXT_216691 [Caerostris extrusa]|uniref:Uncharacterized protein n=1 Tax=Caerostris extrusa TaxID=172846 RepID=A0AAV4QIJ3_CAEEX|nr:hypothetical protein CEXT_216691 [Caerostris extrusa]